MSEQNSLYEKMTAENKRFYSENPELLGVLMIFKLFKMKEKVGLPLKEFDDWLEARFKAHKEKTEDISARESSTEELEDWLETELREYEQELKKQSDTLLIH